MEPKTEEQTCSWVHSSDCICHLCLTPKQAEPQSETKTEQQTNERAARLAELTERAKQVAEEIHKEVCAVNRTPEHTPYIGVAKMHFAPSFTVLIGRFHADCTNMGDIFAQLESYDPNEDKNAKIAALEAELAALKGGAK